MTNVPTILINVNRIKNRRSITYATTFPPSSKAAKCPAMKFTLLIISLIIIGCMPCDVANLRRRLSLSVPSSADMNGPKFNERGITKDQKIYFDNFEIVEQAIIK
uniref:Uncharacterized protein n=1 Tax=Romanomermis culicivorax TaxID=13658 RepID=A0A915IC79_ROMCU